MGESKIIFTDGKKVAMKSLFNSDNTDSFPYLALGYDADSNGFTDSQTENGFNEITDDTYERIPLTNGIDKDVDATTGKVTVEFTANLDYTNIKTTKSINQLAIVDSQTKHDGNTRYYAATMFPPFSKNEGNSITFTIGFRF